MLTPTQQWQWNFDWQSDCLCLSLGDDWSFVTAFSSKQLTRAECVTHAFSVEECQFYTTILEQLQLAQTAMTNAQLMQIAINATAYRYFGKEISPKNWYFDAGVGSAEHEILVSVAVDGKNFNAVVISHASAFSVCLLLDKSTTTKTGKQLAQFSAIKLCPSTFWPHTLQVASNTPLKFA